VDELWGCESPVAAVMPTAKSVSSAVLVLRPSPAAVEAWRVSSTWVPTYGGFALYRQPTRGSLERLLPYGPSVPCGFHTRSPLQAVRERHPELGGDFDRLLDALVGGFHACDYWEPLGEFRPRGDWEGKDAAHESVVCEDQSAPCQSLSLHSGQQ
jgi:hypothetical protein